MGKIKLLDTQIINMIAAGEIVENISSVVKELIENSIDANSTKIKIALKEYGFKEILVLDDGNGIERDDISLSIMPHATSKVATKEDIFNIKSLGFRGEALACIAAVSTITITSSINGYSGYFCMFKAGEKAVEGITPLNKGTMIKVSNLFFNTPARLQNMQDGHIEYAYVKNIVAKFSLAYPKIAFELSMDDKKDFETFGSGDIKEVIQINYGLEVAKKMYELSEQNSYFRIVGFISSPEITRVNRNCINIFVNNRLIYNKNIVEEIITSYNDLLMVGRFPIIILYINLDPRLVDVNVHPNKKSVRFSAEDNLLELIKTAVTRCLAMNKRSTSIVNNLSTSLFEEDETEQVYQKEELDVKFQNVSLIEETKEDSNIANFKLIGRFLDTYILAYFEDDFYMMDQHAVAERINYEKIVSNLNEDPITYELLVAINLEFDTVDLAKINQKITTINDLGVFFDDFGHNTITIRKIPSWIKQGYEKEYLEEIIYKIINENFKTYMDFCVSTAKTIACKKSIKARTYVSDESITYLFYELSKCKDPYHCPHGRPSIIKYSKTDIEKMFKRIV